CLQGYLTPFTF
nr:immunoglobulin light chain junction region [Macaca mulatta]